MAGRHYITDHAVLRYLERAKGMDIAGIRREMDQPGIRAAVKSGAQRIHINGICFICENGHVVTIYDKKRTKRQKHCAKKKRAPNMKRRRGGTHRSKKADY